MKTLPNFLIVGSAKAGTTSLNAYLNQHPEVFTPSSLLYHTKKEPHFFLEKSGLQTAEEYEQLFLSVNHEKAIGEASGGYLYDPSAPNNIHNFLGPDVKIIIILRNPIDMTYSLWGHMVRMGHEQLSFFEALQVETVRMEDDKFKRTVQDWVYNFAYVDRAKYAKQVKRYLDKFTHVKVLFFEEFFQSPESHYKDLCKFLDVSDEYVPEFKVFNPSGGVRSKYIRRIMNDASAAWREPVKKLLPTKCKNWLKTHINQLNRIQAPMPALSVTERENLRNIFIDDVAKLEQLVGRRLPEAWDCV